MARACQIAQHIGKSDLGRIVQASSRLVKQQEWRSRSEHDGQCQQQSLSLGEIARMRGVQDLRRQQRKQCTRSAGVHVRIAVCRLALVSNGGGFQQIAGDLRHKSDRLQQLSALECTGILAVGADGSRACVAQTDHGVEQSGLARAIPSHQGHDLASVNCERDVAQR